MSYTLLSSFAYMDVAPEGEHGCNFFHISEERGFGLIILIMGLDRGTSKLVEVRAWMDTRPIGYRRSSS